MKQIGFWIYTITIVVSIALLAIGNYHAVSIALIAGAVMLIIFDPTKAVILGISSFPVDQFISAVTSTSFGPGRILIFVGIFAGLWNKVQNRDRTTKIIANNLALYLLILIIGITTLFWVDDLARGAIYLAKIFVLIIWAWSVVPLIASRTHINTISLSLLLFTCSLALIMLSKDVGRLSNVNDRLLFEGLGINSIATSFGLVMVLSLAFIRDNKKPVVIFIFSIANIIIFLALLKMGTRSIVLGVPLAIVLASMMTNPTKIIRNSAITLFLFSAFYYGTYFATQNDIISPRLADRFIGLFSATTYTENSRVSLAEHSLEYVLNNPIGAGPGNEKAVFQNLNYKVQIYESHNTLISTIVQFGILGFLIQAFALAQIATFSKYIENKTDRLVFFSILIFFMISIVKASLLQTRLYWIPLVLLYSLIQYEMIRNSIRRNN